MNQINLNRYKQEIADLYTARSDTYDNNLWHQKIANRLVEYGKIKPNQCILDIATGTGYCAIASGKLLGETGKVIGVDISPEMISKARNKGK